MTEEIWKDITGYEGQYQVSSEGRVKSLARKFIDKSGREQNIKERILKLSNDKDGYKVISLSDGYGRKKHFRVHRLVADAYILNLDNKPQVNHIDEDKSNNRVNNLEWVTPEENNNHGTHNVRISKSLSKIRCKPVAQLTVNDELVKVWESAHEAAREEGFVSSSISKVALGKQKTHHGYIWKYIVDEDNIKNTTKNFSKPVAQITLDGKLIRIYESTREAGRQTGFNYRLIGLVANGKQKTHKGYIWKYVSQ